MTHDPTPTTDIFDYLCGDGFVMMRTAREIEQSRLKAKQAPSSPRPVWPGIEDDVADLERLLR